MSVAPMRFTRGTSLYQIAPAYVGGEGYIGLCDGRIIARAAERAEVARALITVVTVHGRRSVSAVGE